MFPIRSREPRYHIAFVTGALITCNLLAFFYELMQGDDLPGLIRVLGLRPALFTWYWWTGSIYVWLPFVTSMFLHGGWLHLAGNMLFLWVFGAGVEERLGHGRFTVLYLLAGLAASLTQISMSPDSPVPVIGASGAIAGVLGAYLFLFPRARVLTLIFIIIFPLLIDLPAVALLVIWFANQLLAGVASLETGEALYGGVAYWGHIGGFVAGAILGLLLAPETAARSLK
ncbi:MAG TPA: rhomboid family intramembrane serine protease [Pyrinomonadaceae bacterium]|jgi:membrane associated rhomboid family serine protease